MKCKSFDDYIKYIESNYHIHDKTVKVNNVINTIVNLIPIGILTSWFLLGKISWIQLVNFSIIAYIAYDFVGILFDKIIIAINICSYYIHMQLFYKKFNASDFDTQKNILDSLQYKNDNSTDDIELHELKEKIEYCNEMIKKKEKLEKETDDALLTRRLSDYEKAKEKFDNIKKYEGCPNIFKSDFKKILNESEELLKIAEKKLYVMDGLNKTFNIYFNELISLFESYERLEKEEQKKNAEVINTILKEFLNHINELSDRVQEDSKLQFEINSQILLESLKKGEKKHV